MRCTVLQVPRNARQGLPCRLRCRAFPGSGAIGLDTVKAALGAGIAAGDLPRDARGVFDEARRRRGTEPAVAGDEDDELDRLIGRIQALRAKTVEQGCTEAEALAAAEKVAELLDRYGLSLSELDLKRQACEGLSVETGRRRVGPMDDWVAAMAAFFDCRAWGENSASGTLRHVFFGLPADLVAARFRAGDTYASMPARVQLRFGSDRADGPGCGHPCGGTHRPWPVARRGATSILGGCGPSPLFRLSVQATRRV